MNYIGFNLPEYFGISKEIYAKQVLELLKKDTSIKEKDNKIPTVAVRDLNSLKKKYSNSVIAVFQEKDDLNLRIIGNAILAPTNQVNNPLKIDNSQLFIGELETVIIDTDLQIKGLGKKLLYETHSLLSSQYDILIMATLNPVMVHLSTKYLGYKNLNKLPKSFEKEGIDFFVKTDKISEEDFYKNATSLVKFNKNFDDVIKEQFIEIFLDS